MAKEDKGSEDYEFEVPDFDEDAFIHKELVSFKTTGILFAWGILAALISWGLWEATGANKTGWYLGLVVMVVFGYLLRYVYRVLKVDIDHFGRREWFGTFFLLFFAWLSFFILFVNPPISDHADPTAAVFAAPSVQQVGGDVNLEMFAADNFRVGGIQFTLSKGATTIATVDDLLEAGAGHWTYSLPNAATGLYTYTFTVEDSRGNEATVEGEVLVSSQALRLDMPEGNTLTKATDLVSVTVRDMKPCDATQKRDGGDCVRTVYLTLDNGNVIPLEYHEQFQWHAGSANAGWSNGNNTFSVTAEQANQFQGHHMIPGGDLHLAGPFTINVDAVDNDYEAKVTPEVLDAPITRNTPGFGAVALIAILGGFAILAKRRQE